MSKPRGRSHTTLTETAELVVKTLYKLPGIKMIAPGQISTTSKRGSGARHVTSVYTTAGLELIISGQSVQKVAVHTENPRQVCRALETAKSLRDFSFSHRDRKPGV